MKVFVVGGANNYANFISNAILVDDITQAQVVLFTGGEDVSPEIYGKTRVANIYCNINRDIEETKVFRNIRTDQLVVGVCRGSQFCCVMNGGNLVQDCDKHALSRTHRIISNDGKMMYEITSTHHQMQYPFDLPIENYEILFYAEEVPTRIFGDHIDPIKILGNEPEIVLYKTPGKPKCLAIQGHPEMMPDSPVAKMLDKLIKSYVK